MDNNINEVKATDPSDHTVAVMKTMTESHFKYEMQIEELQKELRLFQIIAVIFVWIFFCSGVLYFIYG